jgi:hypothetical protein
MSAVATLLFLYRAIWALFLGYVALLLVASWAMRRPSLRLRAFAVAVGALVPAAFMAFWCFLIGFGSLVLLPASAPGPDAVDGEIEPGPTVASPAGAPFVVGRVVIVCLGDGRPFHVSATMVGSRHLALRRPDGSTLRVEVPVVGEWVDSREWQDEEPRDAVNAEDTAEVDSLDGVPGSEDALQRCPPRGSIHPRWRVSVRALRAGEPIVVGRTRDGQGPFVRRGTLAALHRGLDLTPGRLLGRGIATAVFGLLAWAAFRGRRYFATSIDSEPARG